MNSPDPLDFYEIQSKKSQELIDGLRKISLACSNHPEIFCFLWFDPLNQLKSMQLIFDEKLVQWTQVKGLVSGETNRRFQNIFKKGILKGSRTIQETRDPQVLKEGITILSESIFPGEYKQIIHNSVQELSKGFPWENQV
ncbi:MAG: hypothetical protein OEY59_01810 [Deltaproteobacteria bacterium]|nr:hypothetical protein [Deltaproteobacteria bacterium]